MRNYILIVVFILVFCGCKTQDNNIPQLQLNDLIGIWVNQSDSNDTLFWSDSSIKRIDTITMQPKHSYSFSIDGSTIRIKYTGEYYIGATEQTYGISLNSDKSALLIDGLHEYFPEYPGDEFIKISNQ
ncbi:MAG: hypothetical protein ABFS32_16590 [Bacteroidota bacterium]